MLKLASGVTVCAMETSGMAQSTNNRDTILALWVARMGSSFDSLLGGNN
jgi:hypothetical protein